MNIPEVILTGEQLAIAAATYVRSTMGIKMNYHETKLICENGDIYAIVQPVLKETK